MFGSIKLKEAGLTLIELAIVVAIISSLLGLAKARYDRFKSQAKQTEAKVNLRTISHLQEERMLTNFGYYMPADPSAEELGYLTYVASGNTIDGCNKQNGLGFKLGNCPKVRYTYELNSSTHSANPQTKFIALARAKILQKPTSPPWDYWAVNSTLTIGNCQDGLKEGSIFRSSVRGCNENN